jgi:hypothetical protein
LVKSLIRTRKLEGVLKQEQANNRGGHRRGAYLGEAPGKYDGAVGRIFQVK